MTERQLHRAVAQYLAAALPPHIPWTSIGHGGGGDTRGAILRGLGLKPGFPDILIVVPPGGRVLGIELKTEKGRLSPAQRETHAMIRAAGGIMAVCRTVEEVEQLLRPLIELKTYVEVT